MWMMLQHKEPGDYVVATGEQHSVKEFLEEAFSYAGLNWQSHVEIDKRYFRPIEVESLLGDNSKVRKTLNWKPKVKFLKLVRMMVDADMDMVSKIVHGLKGEEK